MNLKAFLFVLFFTIYEAGAAVRDQVWAYRLLEGSSLLDECAVCGRPSIPIDMRGVFWLRLVEETPISTKYAVESLDFHAGEYQFTGSGTFELSGEVALRQTITMTGDLQTAEDSTQVSFTSEGPAGSRRWPMIAVSVTQKDGTFLSTVTLKIAAAPITDIWFSTVNSFHASSSVPPDDAVSSGDLLSYKGFVVKRNSELQNFPGPTFENVGLDAIDIRPGAEIVFSGETAGPLNDGDFANVGKVSITHWQDFMKYLPQPPVKDPGLDGLKVISDTEICFSIKENITGIAAVGHGDLLLVSLDSKTSAVLRKNSDLLANFHPAEQKDFGLDAFYIWPSGEIWFSTTDGFSDNQLGIIGSGDLLSDSGYIVYRNLELMAAFAPLEDLSNFGLDALFIISDAAAELEGARIAIVKNPENGFMRLNWSGSGRVFEVQRASNVEGPWEPISPIIPELNWEVDSGASNAFFRVRQW